MSKCQNVGIEYDTSPFAYFPGSFKELSHKLCCSQAEMSNRCTPIIQRSERIAPTDVYFALLKSNQATIRQKMLDLDSSHRHQVGKKCCLSNFGALYPPHNFSSNCLRAACGEDKHHAALDGSCQVTFPRLYCPFSWSQYRRCKTETGHFQTHIFSFLAEYSAS